MNSYCVLFICFNPIGFKRVYLSCCLSHIFCPHIILSSPLDGCYKSTNTTQGLSSILTELLSYCLSSPPSSARHYHIYESLNLSTFHIPLSLSPLSLFSQKLWKYQDFCSDYSPCVQIFIHNTFSPQP